MRPSAAGAAVPFAECWAEDVARRWGRRRQQGDGGRGRARGRDHVCGRGGARVRGGRRDRPGTEWRRTKPEMVRAIFCRLVYVHLEGRPRQGSVCVFGLVILSFIRFWDDI